MELPVPERFDLHALPSEALFVVTSFLDDLSLCRLAETCRVFRDFVFDDSVWRPRLARRWQLSMLSNDLKHLGGSDSLRRAYALVERRARSCRPYARHILEDMERSMSDPRWLEFPHADALTHGRVRTRWRIFDNPDGVPTVVGFFSTMIIHRPSSVVTNLLTNLAEIPRWDRIMISLRRLAYIEDGIDVVQSFMPHKTFVQLVAQDRAPGVYRVAGASTGPSDLVDVDGNQIEFGVTNPLLSAEGHAMLEEMRNSSPEHRELLEDAIRCRQSWHMLPSGCVIRDIDDCSCSVSKVFRLDTKFVPSSHMAFRLCGMRTLICYNLLKICEEEGRAEEQAREKSSAVLERWGVRLSKLGVAWNSELPGTEMTTVQ